MKGYLAPGYSTPCTIPYEKRVGRLCREPHSCPRAGTVSPTYFPEVTLIARSPCRHIPILRINVSSPHKHSCANGYVHPVLIGSRRVKPPSGIRAGHWGSSTYIRSPVPETRELPIPPHHIPILIDGEPTAHVKAPQVEGGRAIGQRGLGIVPVVCVTSIEGESAPCRTVVTAS